jgi:plasmid stabilization system protein ParE
MSRQIIFELEARLEFEDAVAWYDAQRPGLGDEFVAEIDAALLRILKHPGRFPLAGITVRKARVKVFESYSIYFSVERDFIGIVSVFHGAHDPAELRRRLR